MKRLMVCLAVSSATALIAGAQSIVVRPYVWHDDASSDFSASFANGCLTLSDTSTDCQGDSSDWYSQCGWGNRHHWFLSLDGISPTWFDPDADGSSLELEVTFDLTPVMQGNRSV